MYSHGTLRFLCSERTRLKAARDVFQQPVNLPEKLDCMELIRYASIAMWPRCFCLITFDPGVNVD